MTWVSSAFQYSSLMCQVKIRVANSHNHKHEFPAAPTFFPHDRLILWEERNWELHPVSSFMPNGSLELLFWIAVRQILPAAAGNPIRRHSEGILRTPAIEHTYYSTFQLILTFVSIFQSLWKQHLSPRGCVAIFAVGVVYPGVDISNYAKLYRQVWFPISDFKISSCVVIDWGVQALAANNSQPLFGSMTAKRQSKPIEWWHYDIEDST